MVFSLKTSFHGGLLLIFINNYAGGKSVSEDTCRSVPPLCHFFLFEARYILQLKKAKRNNQPNKRYPQCLVYTCNLCLQNSVKTQLTKKISIKSATFYFFF